MPQTAESTPRGWKTVRLASCTPGISMSRRDWHIMVSVLCLPSLQCVHSRWAVSTPSIQNTDPQMDRLRS